MALATGRPHHRQNHLLSSVYFVYWSMSSNGRLLNQLHQQKIVANFSSFVLNCIRIAIIAAHIRRAGGYGAELHGIYIHDFRARITQTSQYTADRCTSHCLDGRIVLHGLLHCLHRLRFATQRDATRPGINNSFPGQHNRFAFLTRFGVDQFQQRFTGCFVSLLRVVTLAFRHHRHRNWVELD